MSERTQITIETRRMLVVHGPVEWARMWCPRCSELVYTLTTESAATLTHLTIPRIAGLLDSGRLHGIGTPDSTMFICLNSINAYQEGEGPDVTRDFDSRKEGGFTNEPFGFHGRYSETASSWPGPPDGWAGASETMAGPLAEFQLAELHEGAVAQRPHPGHFGGGNGLTQALFDGLLARLDSDRERAGYKYEEIRNKLIRLFECRGSYNPADLADETINRVARKIDEGHEIWIDDPAIFFYGVARNVLKESFRIAGRQVPIECLERFQDNSDEVRSHEKELEACLAQLDVLLSKMPSQSRELITRYYQGRGTAKIQSRMVQAQSLGIPVTALRTRVHRIREKLRKTLMQEMRKREM